MGRYTCSHVPPADCVSSKVPTIRWTISTIVGSSRRSAAIGIVSTTIADSSARMRSWSTMSSLLQQGVQYWVPGTRHPYRSSMHVMLLHCRHGFSTRMSRAYVQTWHLMGAAGSGTGGALLLLGSSFTARPVPLWDADGPEGYGAVGPPAGPAVGAFGGPATPARSCLVVREMVPVVSFRISANGLSGTSAGPGPVRESLDLSLTLPLSVTRRDCLSRAAKIAERLMRTSGLSNFL